MAWTLFVDLSSGGGLKVEPYRQIFIEAPDEAAAIRIFEERFGRHPLNVTCECCGSDYSIYQEQRPASQWTEQEKQNNWFRNEPYLEIPEEPRYIERLTGVESIDRGLATEVWIDGELMFPLPAHRRWVANHPINNTEPPFSIANLYETLASQGRASPDIRLRHAAPYLLDACLKAYAFMAEFRDPDTGEDLPVAQQIKAAIDEATTPIERRTDG